MGGFSGAVRMSCCGRGVWGQRPLLLPFVYTLNGTHLCLRPVGINVWHVVEKRGPPQLLSGSNLPVKKKKKKDNNKTKGFPLPPNLHLLCTP